MKGFIYLFLDTDINYTPYVKALKENGFDVFGVGKLNKKNLDKELINNLKDYYFCDIDDFSSLEQAIQEIMKKYKNIEYLESNNEYHLLEDAKLREEFKIKGLYPNDLEYFLRKTKIKEILEKENIKVSKCLLITDENKEELRSFVKEYKFPVYIKPDSSLKTHSSFKIEDYVDLVHFQQIKPRNIDYIVEPFIEGEIIAYDGISDSTSSVIFANDNNLSISLTTVFNGNKDVFYYTSPKVKESLDKIGRKVVKALNIKNRFFHIEFFKLKKDVNGLGNKDDLILLEVKLRTPGGFTADLVKFAKDVNLYKVWSDSLVFDKTDEDLSKHGYYAGCASRSDERKYVYSHEDIMSKYKDKICKEGRYSYSRTNMIGDTFYIARFKTYAELKEFKDFVLACHK